jgi:hypothetical protein
LGPTDATYPYSTTDSIFTNYGPDADAVPASPSKLANIRIRRCNNGSTLLQSPARDGHAARMRQIFEEAGREQHTPQVDKGVLYPQLPNISRKTSPPPEYHTPQPSPIRRPESLCMSTSSFQIKPQQLQVPASEPSSESWSDDSAYFIAGSRRRTTSNAVCPKERITDWLVSVSASEWEEGFIDPKDGDRCNSRESMQYTQPELDDYFTSKDAGYASSPHSENRKYYPPLHPTTQDPFIQNENSTCTSTSTSGGASLFKRNWSPSDYATTPPISIPNTTQSTVIIRPHPSPTKRRDTNTTASRPTPLHLTTPQRSPTKTLILEEEGGIQLSPLSPNVCISRGPARYHHSLHRRSNADHTAAGTPPPTKEHRTLSPSLLSPTREREGRLSRFRSNNSLALKLEPTREYGQVVAQLKENNAGMMGRTDGKGKEAGNSPCKIGVGTRFQHPRHGMKGVGRFAHGVWGRGGLLDDV